MKRLVAVALLSCAWPAAARVAGSKHDFSTTGPGEYRAATERDVCIFCHVSHRAGPQSLSNRPDTTATHRPYESSTMQTAPGAPSGASRLCLSCHDGTIAVGQTRTRTIKMVKGNQPLERGHRANLGTDLRQSHPISMASPAAGAVRPPLRGDAVHLDGQGLVQCTSCHDPHEEFRDPEIGKFLVKPSARSAICVSCHASTGGARSATHLTSTAKYADLEGRDRTISDAGCGTCHVPHAADVRGRLLKSGVADDDVCLRCHAAGTEKPIAPDLAKAWAHVSPQSGKHDAGEGPRAPDSRRLPETSPGASRHVACVDCHDPHASNPTRPVAPAAGGALAGVWGIDLSGEKVSPARYEYEICLKCHGDSANKPQELGAGSLDRIRRAQDDLDLRRVFAPTAVSFHPVAAPGKSPSVPGLLPPWSAGSRVLCTDCHASDAGPGAGGSGARGPHGSVYPYLLERQYLTRDYTPESPSSYALCYKCHDRDTLLSSASGFPHKAHVSDRSAPCSACHDGHGVSRETGTDRNNAHLVSFDLGIVRTGRAGMLQYESTGTRAGSCTLTCHDTPHGPGLKAFSY